MTRGGPSGGANGKKLANPRGRHLSEEFYDDRKSHGVRGGASRGDPLKGHSDKPLTRSRDAQRRIKPLMPELSEVRVQNECWHPVLYCHMLAFMVLQNALSDSLRHILDKWNACGCAGAKYACFVF